MADSYKINVKWDDRALRTNIIRVEPKVLAALAATMAFHAPRAAAYARQNAPWRDRTGNARQGLFAQASRDKNSFRLTIGHGVPYGIWLEVRFSGRYSIIRPTVDHEGPLVMATARRLVRETLGG